MGISSRCEMLSVLALTALLWTAPTVFALSLDSVEHKGQDAYRIATDNAVYFFHKYGAGFSGIIDSDSTDWITYSDSSGSAGEFRGIPNMGPCCHPGYNNSSSRIVANTPDRVSIESQSDAVKTVWDIYPTHATLTVTEASENFYMLYEGTPGGAIDANDFMGFPDGTEKDIDCSRWQTNMSPEWIFFGDRGLGRSLLFVHHVDDSIDDQYWLMNTEMTVFGFGRTCRGACQGMSETPNQLSIALVESVDHNTIREKVGDILGDPTHRDNPVRSASRSRIDVRRRTGRAFEVRPSITGHWLVRVFDMRGKLILAREGNGNELIDVGDIPDRICVLDVRQGGDTLLRRSFVAR